MYNYILICCGYFAVHLLHVFDGLFEKLNVTRSQKGGAGN